MLTLLEEIKLLATAVGDGTCIHVDVQDNGGTLRRFVAFAERECPNPLATTIEIGYGRTESEALENLKLRLLRVLMTANKRDSEDALRYQKSAEVLLGEVGIRKAAIDMVVVPEGVGA